jgi:pimeloyl-ACP methyl ester carboxylesterase
MSSPERVVLLIPGHGYSAERPLLPLPADLRRATAPFLLVGATGDRSWDPAVARSLGRPVHEVEGADHGLEVGDPVRSAEILRDVTVAMDRFVSSL